MTQNEDSKRYIIGAHNYQAPVIENALYLVSTPIGNLGDITIRALEVLAACDVLACEDTRTTRVLLDRYAIHKKAVSYHEHNAQTSGPMLIESLLSGKSVALVSDAGTPLISDPGFRLVTQAREAGIKVVPIPGASALLTALVATGLPTDSFFFNGFLPTKKGARIKQLQDLSHMDTTLIFYESPHRAAETLADMAEVFGADRPAALTRELTKTFETFDCDNLGNLAQKYAEVDRIRGEIVLVVGRPLAKEKSFDANDIDALLLDLAKSMPAPKAAQEAASITGQKRQELYLRLMALRSNDT
ncbi:16S rRNA (cytidine(1402)-2'-O)-methyltransferase [Bartonella sp. HY761]|uniref:16S rRNA (cytidine(1402)-2'-O)-methyltransferase n=1 Tax=Bartonella sp. HY761 TaxID=2979330 RepID=UPI002205166C|nr:16S rRNA (cytidine(1402)-2'-O)-methyltransferase [Bartonella sp. HY761]UXN06750.1 16S rRNA (cytidine(1402)-2'-O)-methyltransferase [Bartonella sp. HY761]